MRFHISRWWHRETGFTIAARSAVAIFGLMALMLSPPRAATMDEQDKIVVAAYAYALGSTGDQTACLSRGGITLKAPSDGQKIGNGTSDNVVAALKSRGYHVVSSEDCVYDSTGGLHARTLASSDPTQIIFVDTIDTVGDKFLVEVSYWSGRLTCKGETLEVSFENGAYNAVHKEEDFIC